jgi:hypothetical protein
MRWISVFTALVLFSSVLKASPCSTELLNSFLPEPFRVYVTDQTQSFYRDRLMDRWLTDFEISSVLSGWHRDLCVTKFLKDKKGTAALDFFHDRGVRSRGLQRIILSAVSPEVLGRAMREPSTLAAETSVQDLVEVFQESALGIRNAIQADLDRLRSMDPIYTFTPRSYDTAFAALERRTGRDATELKDEYLRAFTLGQIPTSGKFGLSFLSYWQLVDPLFSKD